VGQCGFLGEIPCTLVDGNQTSVENIQLPLILHQLILVNNIHQPQIAINLLHVQWMRNEICDIRVEVLYIKHISG
jgi:hypothetical protein